MSKDSLFCRSMVFVILVFLFVGLIYSSSSVSYVLSVLPDKNFKMANANFMKPMKVKTR